MTPTPEYINPKYKAGGKLSGKVALITGKFESFLR